MPTWDVQVDHEVLEGVGRDVSEVAVTMRQAVTRAGSDLAPPPLPGFEAGTAAVEAQAVWVAALEGFASRIDGHGMNLRQAAKTYLVADQKVSRAMTRIGSGGL